MSFFEKIFFVLCCCLSHSECLPLTKINDGLYSDEILNKGLYLVMERVTLDNVNDWRHYAATQAGIKRMSSELTKRYGINPLAGSLHFKEVLDGETYKNNEVWVAYITSNPHIENISSDKTIGYSIDEMFSKSNNFAKDIKMFMTVTSDPKAILSTHLGITNTIENLESKDRPKGISLNLHAFAARVMRNRNQNLRFMINAPDTYMEKILYDNLPKGSVIIGTKEMKQLIDQANEMDFDSFLQKNIDVIDKIKERLPKAAQRAMQSANKELSWRLENIEKDETPVSIRKEMEQNEGKKYLEINKEDTFSVSKEKLNKALEEEINFKFQQKKNPIEYFIYPKDHLKALLGSSDIYTKLFQENEPILSVDNEPILYAGDAKRIKDKFILYDPRNLENILIKADNSMPNYSWMFEETYKPAGSTHYIVVDLEQLEKSKF